MDAVLRRVVRPGRDVGGEYGAVVKSGGGLYRVAVSYPDLYEIGMSNMAVRLLYGRINALEGVACERVFAPDLDLERELRAAGIPLFTLETRTPLARLDMLGFSVGYELTLTNVLTILDVGGIAVMSADRGPDAPIVIGGGPVASNPAGFGKFFDAVFVGEGEEWVERELPELARMKSGGAGRREILARLVSHPSVWCEGKQETVRRSIWRGFGPAVETPGPVSSLKIVQDEGSVEIMRGCPNGCRFCHAGRAIASKIR